VTGLTPNDVQRMRDQLFVEGPERRRRLSKFWLLLVLSAVIASAGVISDSTATVIGAMIVAPLMTPILGVVVAIVLADRRNLLRSIVLVVFGALSVIGIAWLMGHFVPYPVVAQTNTQVAARVSPRIIDLVAALATGAVGSVALARSDISDTLPGVAIAISLVPPLAVVGLTLESGASHQAIGALLLFLSNVAAILATGVIVMGIYRLSGAAVVRTDPSRDRLRKVSVALVAVFLVGVIVPLKIDSDRIDATRVRETDVTAVAQNWAHASGWTVVSVATRGGTVYVDAAGPEPEPALTALQAELGAAGLDVEQVRVSLQERTYLRVEGPR
jgi:uncharacterized hydrophobic protein (TIGR00271 family)